MSWLEEVTEKEYIKEVHNEICELHNTGFKKEAKELLKYTNYLNVYKQLRYNIKYFYDNKLNYYDFIIFKQGKFFVNNKCDIN